MTWQTNAWRPRTARVERLESNAMSEWCFQCGVAQKPERAIGWDEDGEPACALHQVKEIGAGLNAAAASRTAVSAPIGSTKAPGLTAAGVSEVTRATARDTGNRQIPAAPSPAQTSVKEKSMANNKGAREPRPCPVEGCGREIAACYMNQHLRAAHGTEAAGVAVPKKPRKVAQQIEPSNADRIDRLTDHVNREIGVAQEVPLHLRVDVGGGLDGAPRKPVVHEPVSASSPCSSLSRRSAGY
jgi:hypothetical protein